MPTTTIPFLKVSRNPTFSVPNNPQSPTLLGSNFGTKSYVLRSLWNLLLSNSNSRLLSPGHTLRPRFLSLGNTRRVPVTRQPETTSRSNSPVYPRRGTLSHAGDYSTLTTPQDGSGSGSTPTTIYSGTRSRAPNYFRVRLTNAPPETGVRHF